MLQTSVGVDDDDDWDVAWRRADLLADLLAERGDLDGLRARADAGEGDSRAARRLAGLLAKRGDLDGLQARADAGDGDGAGVRLIDMPAQTGRREESERLRRFGFNCPLTMKFVDQHGRDQGGHT